jgi:TadE-like protein
VNRFWQDSEGGALVEFSVIFPMFLLAAFGTVDFSYMLFDWSMANKATFVGARRAVVLDPVASGITTPTYNSTQKGNIGQWCFDPATGAIDSNHCPTENSTCTPAASNGSCTSGYGWNEIAFTNPTATNEWQKGILDKMQAAFPRLQRQNVQISYQTNNLGFAGRPGGLPMNVTVSIRCMTHQFYFINALMGWIFAAPTGCPAGTPAGPSIPAFATTLTSEDMDSSL